jgi:hypothetical protein
VHPYGLFQLRLIQVVLTAVQPSVVDKLTKVALLDLPVKLSPIALHIDLSFLLLSLHDSIQFPLLHFNRMTVPLFVLGTSLGRVFKYLLVPVPCFDILETSLPAALLILLDFLNPITDLCLLSLSFLFCHALFILKCKQGIVESRVSPVELQELMVQLVSDYAPTFEFHVAVVLLHLCKYIVH